MDVRVGLKESWASKNLCFWSMVLEKTLESPLDWKEFEPVNPTGNQFWIFIGRADAEAEAPILWPLVKNWLTGKDPDTGKDWRQEKGMTEDEMVGWHYWLNGYEFEQALGVGEVQGSLVCCSPWGGKESDITERLNWILIYSFLWCFQWVYSRLLVVVQTLSFASNSLQPCGIQHGSLPCPLLFPRVCSDSCPLSQWCYLTIPSSATPFSFGFNLSEHQGLFQWVGSLHQVAKVLELQL